LISSERIVFIKRNNIIYIDTSIFPPSMQSTAYKCKYHPQETIERVSISPNATKSLYCLECVLEVTDDQLKPSIIKLS